MRSLGVGGSISVELILALMRACWLPIVVVPSRLVAGKLVEIVLSSRDAPP